MEQPQVTAFKVEEPIQVMMKDPETVAEGKRLAEWNRINTQWSFSTQNVPGRRKSSFYLHLPEFIGVKAVYPGNYKIFLSCFVKFVFIIG